MKSFVFSFMFAVLLTSVSSFVTDSQQPSNGTRTAAPGGSLVILAKIGGDVGV